MEMNLYLCSTFFLIVLTLVMTYRKISTNTPKEKSPPEAQGGWPLIGHLPLLSGRLPEPPHIILSNMADKHGPIFSIRLGVHRCLVVSSWEIARECFTDNDLTFSNRPKVSAIQHMGYNFAMYGFSEYGSYWRQLRKISMLKLLSNHKVSSLGSLFQAEVRAMMRSLHSSCIKNDEKMPVEMKRVLGDLNLNLIVRIVAGGIEDRSTNSFGGSEKLHEATGEFFRMMGVLTIPDVLPFLKWLEYFGGTNKDFKKAGKKLDGLMQEWLEQHKKNCDSVDNGQGFMAEMVVAANRLAKEFPQHDADTINKATCQTMILGGSGAMTATLTWALCLLLNNRHAMKRAQEEVDMHVGRERQVRETDLPNLTYIQAIIKETLRLFPPGLLSPPRESSDDCTIAGYNIPAGTRLMINVWRLHRDPRVWPEPLEFRPERFVTSHKGVDVRGAHFELLPFGCGRRICPGISFANQLMELALASLLHGFDVETAADEAVDMTGSLGATNEKTTPLEVILTPRLSPNLYA